MGESAHVLRNCFRCGDACGGSAEETVEEPVATEEVETLEAPATTAAPTLDKIVFGFACDGRRSSRGDAL